ncbi:MAG: SdrD B-like domain-containing protein [Acidobacteriota bacterium]
MTSRRLPPKTVLWACLALALTTSAFAAPPAGDIAFTNSNPQVLDVLAAEGWLGAEKSAPADIYRAGVGEQCAAVLDVSFRSESGRAVRVHGSQILAARADGDAFVPQALARVAGTSSRETLVVHGGANFRVEVSYELGVDDNGAPSSVSRVFYMPLGCDTIAPLVIEVPKLRGSDEVRRRSLGFAARSAAPQMSVEKLMGRTFDVPAGDSRGGQAGSSQGAGASQGSTDDFTVRNDTPVADLNGGCFEDDFEDGSLGPDWTVSFIGDANLGSATETGGKVQVSGNGTSLFHGDDNAVFLHRGVTGDYRFEATLEGFPVNAGGDFKKSGIQARFDNSPNAARIFVQMVPDHPLFNTTALQFDYRDENGDAFELASQTLNIPLPVDIAIDRRGDLFTVYYSTNGGETWSVPAGAAGGQIEIPGAPEMQVGLSVTSYDAATELTAEFDNVSLCQPNSDPAPDFPPAIACEPGLPYDVMFMLDISGSMVSPYPGADSKLDAARNAIYAMNALLASELPGSRAGLITFAGNRDPEFNKNLSVQLRSGLTMDLAAVDAAAAAIDVASINPLSSTPLATAFEKATEVLQAEHDTNRGLLTVLLTDTVPNVDSNGFGPSPYRFDEVQGISLLDGGGNYLPWGTVAWAGNYNGAIDTYDGQVLGDVMREVIEMKAALPDTVIYGVAIQSDEVFNEELMNFAAGYTSGGVYSVADSNGIINAVGDLVDLVDCGATIAGSVWYDMDENAAQGVGESGLDGVTVELLDSTGAVVATTVTAEGGHYMFDGVLDGSYAVRVVDATLPGVINRPTFDTDGIGTPHLATVTVVGEGDVTGVDFGYASMGLGGGIGCTDDDFNDDFIGPQWMLTNLGDADQASAEETGGKLLLTGDGTELFHGDDNGAFLYQAVEGDFRASAVLEGFTGAGGSYAKGALMVRNGNHPDAARVMVAVVEDYADTGNPAVQFDARLTDGGVPVVLSSTRQNISLPIHVAIERRGAEIIVSVSDDGGLNWVIPAGGLGGSEEIPALAGTAMVGFAAASYDADSTLTVAFDDFELCQPDTDDPPPPPPPPVCEIGQEFDVVYFLDMSGSMTWEFPGMVSKFDAAKASLLMLNQSIQALSGDNRAALITFSGKNDPEYNLNQSVKVRSGLTNELDAVQEIIEDLNMTDIPWQATTPLPLAFETLVEMVNDQRDPTKELKVFWISDSLPNIDMAGEGPEEYPLDVLQTIPLRDGSGDWLPPGVVSWTGIYHGSTGTYCGEPLGKTMVGIQQFAASQPDAQIFGVTLKGDGVNLGTYSFDLNQYAAYYTNGEARLAESAEDLTFQLSELLQVINCGEEGLGVIGDRVWNDADGDGNQDANENGIAGVTVNLLDEDELVILATAVTGPDGDYLFTDVPVGTYTVQVDASTLPATLNEPTYDYDGVGSVHTSMVIIGQFEVNLDIDFGYKPGPVIPPPPVVGCVDDTFDDGVLDDVWKTALIGDATVGDAIVSGGLLNVTGNGSSYFAEDNGFFIYREISNSSFRVEVDLVGSNGAGETIYRKTGLVLGSGLGSVDPRVTIQYQPIWPDARGSLQFRFRTAQGGNGGGTWASSYVDPNLPVRVAIEKDGDTYTAEFSQDGGFTWTRAAGGTQSVINIPMGDALLVGMTATSYSTESTITGYYDNFELCAEDVRVETDEYCVQLAPSSEYNSNGDHALWLPGIAKDLVFLDAGQFVEFSDGTATITGTAYRASDFSKGFEVEVQLSGRTDDAPGGSPKQELHWSAYAPDGPIDPDTWYYYTDFSATLSGVGDWEGAVLDVTPRGPAWQMGVGANNKNLDFGASAWLYYTVVQQPTTGVTLEATGQGDFNLSLVCPQVAGTDCTSEDTRPNAAPSDSHGHALWMPGISKNLLFTSNGTWTTLDNGMATLTGRVMVEDDPTKMFDIEVLTFGRTETPPAGSPKLELSSDQYFPTGPVDPSTWHFYTNWRGTLTGLGEWAGATVELTPRGPAWQVGDGAGNKSTVNGMSAWLSYEVTQQPTTGSTLQATGDGDFNLSLECPPDLEGSFCVTEAWGDQFSGSGNHAIAMPGIAKDLLFFDGANGSFDEYADGTARLTARVHHKDDTEKIFNVTVELSGRTDDPPPGSPKKQLPSSAYAPNGPADPATWYYYTDFSATLTGEGAWDGAVVTITPRGPTWQVGVGASNKNAEYGASAWFNYTVVEQPSTGESLQSSGTGDFNISLPGDCPGDSGGGDGGGDGGDAAWCPKDPQYWMNNLSEWPADALNLGGFAYSFNDLMYFLDYDGSDPATQLARALTAVKLNLQSGSDFDAELTQAVADADQFLSSFPPGSSPSGSDASLADALREDLEDQYSGACGAGDNGGANADSSGGSYGGGLGQSSGGGGSLGHGGSGGGLGQGGSGLGDGDAGGDDDKGSRGLSGRGGN